MELRLTQKQLILVHAALTNQQQNLINYQRTLKQANREDLKPNIKTLDKTIGRYEELRGMLGEDINYPDFGLVEPYPVVGDLCEKIHCNLTRYLEGINRKSEWFFVIEDGCERAVDRLEYIHTVVEEILKSVLPLIIVEAKVVGLTFGYVDPVEESRQLLKYVLLSDDFGEIDLMVEKTLLNIGLINEKIRKD